MKNFNYFLVLISAILVVGGCTHCSRTISNFNGKTKSLNPYGDGTLKIERTSYWGSSTQCFNRIFDNAT